MLEQVTADDLATLVEVLGLAPGYSPTAARVYATHDDVTMWAPAGLGVALPPTLQLARLAASFTGERGDDTDDPPAWQITAALDRQGRSTDQHQ